MKKTWIIIAALLLCVVCVFGFLYGIHIRSNDTSVSDSDNHGEFTKEAVNISHTDVSANGGDTTEIKNEVSQQKYLFLGDSTSTCYEDRDGNPVTSYVSYLSKLRTSYIDCRAIAESTYSNLRPNNVLSQMDGVELSDYDVVFMLFGVNDYIICDDYENTEVLDPETMGGALLIAINRCKDADVRCCVILPYPCADQFVDVTDEVGNYYQSYVDTIKTICANNGVETIDFNTQLGITEENFKENYIDFWHPNNKLHKKAAKYLNEYLGDDSDIDTTKTFS